MERIVEIIKYLFQFQREFFYSLFQFGIAVIVFGVFYIFRKKLSDFKILKIINLKTKQWKFLSVLILLAVASFGLLFAIKMPLLGDEAVYASLSYATGEGLIPYRDFASHIPPFLLYVYGLFFKITDVSILAARILSFIFFLLSLHLIYRIFSFYSKKAYIPTVIFLLLVLLHPSDFSQFFYIGTKEAFAFFIILLSIFFAKNNTEKSLFLSGIFTGLAFLTKQTFLVLLPVYFLMILITNYKKEGLFKKELLFFLGFFIIIIPVLLFFFPYSQQALHNLFISQWKQAYFLQITQFSLLSNRFEQTFLSMVGWFIRHYVAVFIWVFLFVKFFLEFRKKEKISNMPVIILWPIIFIFTFGISSLLFIPASLNRYLIMMNMFLYFSLASLVFYFLKESQWKIEIKRMSLIFIFLMLIFATTNPKQIFSYFPLDNSVMTQYRGGANLGTLIKSLPGYEEKQIVFLGGFQHLLAQGRIPAKKIYPASYWGMKFWKVPFHKNLSLNEAKYYHYMTEKVFWDIIEKKENYIIALEFPSQLESEYKDLIEKSFSGQKTINVGNKLYKIYYQ